MQNPLEKPLEKLQRTIQQMQPELLRVMGAVTLEFIDDNFRLQGFQGATFQPWKPRDPDKDPGRNILVGKGTAHLKNDWHDRYDQDSAIISNSRPYAKAHNEGATIHHPARQGRISFKDVKGYLKMAPTRTQRQRDRIVDSWEGEIGAYDQHMPQRRMIGNSPKLTRDVHDAMIQKVLYRIKNSL